MKHICKALSRLGDSRTFWGVNLFIWVIYFLMDLFTHKAIGLDCLFVCMDGIFLLLAKRP